MLKSYFKKGVLEAGCDEAGRGCLAGPVFAASVILPSDYKNKTLNDSKQISAKKRMLLRSEIEKEAIAFGVGMVDHQEIDAINILNASFLAMHRAIDQLKTTPKLLLIDGNRFNPYPNIAHECIVKGDAQFLSIAAASILAKTYRDDFMLAAHQNHPEYKWNKNKGYPTKAHRAAIASFGATPIHRMTFRLTPD